MSSLGSPSPFLIAGKKSYTVSRSLRFNKDDNAYLTRTPSSAGNRRTWTISIWFKTEGGENLQSQRFWSTSSSLTDGAYGSLAYENDGFIAELRNQLDLRTTGKFRDPTAWYHLVLALDTTQSTASDRAKLYVNGTQVTDFGTASYPSQNHEGGWNSTAEHNIGRELYGTRRYFGGYMTEFNNIDGLQLTPSSFGETDATTGQWIPKQYSGSYGTNGFYLNFSDNSGTTATTLGKDSSGNSNNWTPNGFSVSSGVNNDSLEDTPTLNYPTLNPIIGSGARSGATPSNGNLDVDGTDESTNRATFVFGPGHITTGKWYWEVTSTGGTSGQRAGLTGDLTGSQGSSGVFFRQNNLSWFSSINYKKYTQTSETSDGSYSTGDVIGIAYSADDGEIQYYKNGSLALTDDTLPSVSTTELHIFIFATNSGSNGWPTGSINFGQRAFAYTPPTGYKKLNSVNLPDPTIKKPNQYFDTAIYTGDGSSGKQITGLNFKPDLVWVKCRSSDKWNILVDALRGSTNALSSNSTNAEYAEAHVTSFNSDGFTVADIDSGTANENGFTYVGWSWDAGETDSKTYTVTVVNDGGNKYRFDGFGTSAVTLSLAKGGTYTFNYPSAHPLRFSTTSDGTHGGGSEYTSGVSTYGNSITITVAANAPTLYYYCSQHSGMGGQVNPTTTLGSSNFDGTIQSVAKVNASAGFSITKYTGTGSAGATVGHGLGVTPDVIIIKNRTDSSSSFWAVYHSAAFNSASDPNIIYFNTNQAEADDTNVLGTSVTINSTVFSLGDYNGTNGSGDNMINYCFSEVEGYSKFGKYTGNGSSDGTFVFTGFRPAFVITKNISNAYDWMLFDVKRSPFNDINDYLFPNSSSAEGTGSSTINVDFLSNGFKWRGSSSGNNYINKSGDTFIYLAFAEAPFKYARAR